VSFNVRTNGYPVRHFGTRGNGHIISTLGNGDTCDHGPSPLPMFMVEANWKKVLGQPWIPLNQSIPGFDHEQLEWVLNDSDTIDKIHGAGTYLKTVQGMPEETLYRALQSANAVKSQPANDPPEERQHKS
jgi:hypothetical protein